MKHYCELFILAMISIAFLQSGIDKVVDWKGNKSFFSQHFEKTPFAKFVSLSLAWICLLELCSGVLASIGAYYLFAFQETSCALIAGILSAITFLFLFLGQRIAKDYAGAQTLVVYMLPTFFLVYLLQGC